MVIGSIGLGYALPGAVLLKHDKGVNETFTGMIEVGPDRFNAHIKFVSDRQLVGELLASVLGRATDMPMPNGYLVLAERDDFPDSKILQSSGHATGYGFACSTLGHPSLSRRIRLTSDAVRLDSLKRWKQWAAAIAFDDWIANWDRHDGNLLVGGPGEIWLIDHSHCFVKVDWSIADLKPGASVANQLCAQMCLAKLSEVEKNEKLQEVYSAVQDFLHIDATDAISNARVASWLSLDEAEALREFLTERPTSVAARIISALGVGALAF